MEIDLAAKTVSKTEYMKVETTDRKMAKWKAPTRVAKTETWTAS